MFVGHYSASLAAKAIDPRISLGALFIAAQLVDIAFAVLVLGGVEQVRLVPGFTASNDFDLVYVPFTHSLTATAGWALAGFAIWTVGRNRRLWKGSALLVGATVLAHWFLDLPVHTPDLPLYGNQLKQGFGLWNHAHITLAIEAVLFFGTLAWYYRSTHATRPGGRWGLLLLGLAMFAIQIASVFGPRPETRLEVVAGGLFCYLGFAAAAEYYDRKRS